MLAGPASGQAEATRDAPGDGRARAQRHKRGYRVRSVLPRCALANPRRLSDFKRMATREALSLKLGALLELGEKTTIIGELGKLLVEEIPLQRTDRKSVV